MPEKITITPDEVASSAVDAKLREMGAPAADEQLSGEGFAWSKIIYITPVYMALFGLAGGLLAWCLTEATFALAAGDSDELIEVYALEEEINERVSRGEITQEAADVEIDLLYDKHQDNAYLRLFNDETLSDQERADQYAELETREGVLAAVSIFYFFSFIGISIGLFLSIGDQAMAQNLRGVFVDGSIGIALGLVGAIVGMFAIAFFFEYVIDPIMGEEPGAVGYVVVRGIAWAMFGVFLSIAPGVAMKSWKRCIIGLAGGAIGGAIGGILFDLFGSDADGYAGSRFFALIAIGVVAGAGTGILETAAKTGWVRVTHGLIAGKQFILYKESTYIGSSPQCEIYLFKDPAISPRHAAIHKKGAGYELEDLGSATSTQVNGAPVKRTRLKRGDRIQIGSTVLMFLEKARKS